MCLVVTKARNDDRRRYVCTSNPLRESETRPCDSYSNDWALRTNPPIDYPIASLVDYDYLHRLQNPSRLDANGDQ